MGPGLVMGGFLDKCWGPGVFTPRNASSWHSGTILEKKTICILYLKRRHTQMAFQMVLLEWVTARRRSSA